MSFTHMDIVKCDLRWQIGAIGQAANVFQALCVQNSPHTVADSEVLTDMADWLERILEPLEDHVVVSVDTISANIYKKVGPLWNLVGDVAVAFTPGSIGDPLPSGVAALMTAYTETSKVMGKKYVPGLSETGQTAGLWVAGVLAALATSAVQWVSGFVALNDPLTYWYPGVYSTKALAYKIFQGSAMVRDVPAYQRRRKQGVGI